MTKAKVINFLELTQSELKKYLHYDPITGLFTRIRSTTNNVKVGDICSHKCDKGYLRFRVNKVLYRAHRLAWLYMTGEMPKNFIDHINGDRSDNRFCNLREVTNAENAQNRRIQQKGGKSGLLGVSFDKKTKKYRSRITVDGKTINLGFFETPQEAHSVYLDSKRKLHSTCTI